MITLHAEMSSPLSPRFAELESVISKGMTTTRAVGLAFAEIRDTQLYKETHSTFDDYCRERWSISANYAYRMISAAEVLEDLLPIGNKNIPESQIRPISALPRDDRKAVWQEVVDTAPEGKITAKHVQQVVDRRRPDPPTGKALTTVNNNNPVSSVIPVAHQIKEPDVEVDAWDAAIAATTPIPVAPREDIRPKTSVINGVASADPPDVAEMRAAGKIPTGVIVEVTEPDDAEPEDAPESEVDDASLSDDDWLDSLPLSGELRNSSLRTFRRDALVYRHLEKPRAVYRHHAARILNADKRKQGATGEYAFRVSRFLRIEHPKNWIKCPSAEHGGCGGSGQLPPIGECPKCRGRGYWIA